MPSQSTNDMNVWPADLPSRARWLPYSAEPTYRQPSPSLQPPIPAPPPAPPAPRRKLPPGYWRVRLFVVLGAGLIGIGGGMAAAAFIGGR